MGLEALDAVIRDAYLGLGLLTMVAVSAVTADFAEFAFSPMKGNEMGVVDIAPGAALRQALAPLTHWSPRAGLSYWLILARLHRADQHIQAGLYAVSNRDTPWHTITRFKQGDVIEFSLTIPEGWTFAQALKLLQSDGHVRVTLAADLAEQWAQALNLQSGRPEGWFFPDTYRFAAGTTDLQVVHRAVERMRKLLAQEWERRQPGLPLTSPYDALILASIVEKETAVAEERPRIAAVFLERLRRGMRLETDPTVIYGLGLHFDGDIRTADLRSDTPYNSYLHVGLPPTPIALPGADAIRAVLHPADEHALFFVARGDGSHEFSRTFEEHRQAVIRYQLHGEANRYPVRATAERKE